MARQSHPASVSGVWKKDSVKASLRPSLSPSPASLPPHAHPRVYAQDVAESVGIANLPDEVAAALAGDVEYRLWELIEESMKFMRHSRRTKLKVDDVDQALRVRNLEPLWGFNSSTQHLPFKKTVTATGTVYHVEDDEIDLTKVIKTEVPSVPRDISFTGRPHLDAALRVEPNAKLKRGCGVLCSTLARNRRRPTPHQGEPVTSRSVLTSLSFRALLVSNVVAPSPELAKFAHKPPTAALIPSASSSAQQPSSAVTPLVKHVLSRELQLYFTRLTEALGSGSSGAAAPSTEVREAALGSVRSDPGLHQLVPYLIAWGGEQIANHLDDLPSLQRALDLFHAMLENPTLFVEPYLHQLTPPILTCLLTSALPPVAPDAYPSPPTIRTLAASLLHLLLERHSYAYPSLLPRITKTLLRGLAGESRGLGGRWGAARGLSGIVVGVGAEPAAQAFGGGGGNKAVRDWIGGGLKALGEMIEAEEETYEGERAEVVREVFNVLRASLLPLPTRAPSDQYPSPALAELEDRYGRLFGEAVEAQWDRGGRDVWEAVRGAEERDNGEGGDKDETGSAMEE
ncbi:SPOSA6832_01503 [Sporobolomyces salmonicolor]|uniref:SPOSA6832_01503-mRNA-1:cds n=1 Tax=Sporidiobolus salmonicolor TaxID=5005 RepID=A0A0D6EIY9_SPOSA|nr:SPOSA6832_01503 [Sporobolomyces salmonicolor]